LLLRGASLQHLRGLLPRLGVLVRLHRRLPACQDGPRDAPRSRWEPAGPGGRPWTPAQAAQGPQTGAVGASFVGTLSKGVSLTQEGGGGTSPGVGRLAFMDAQDTTLTEDAWQAQVREIAKARELTYGIVYAAAEVDFVPAGPYARTPAYVKDAFARI